MNTETRQRLLLGVLIAAFALLVGRQLVPALGGGTGVAAPVSTADGRVDSASGSVEIAELRLEALEHKPASYRPGRDPFRFAPKPPPPPPEPQPAPPPPSAPAPREQRPATPPPPPKPQPPAVEFVFLGSFGVPGREIAVFADGKEILNAFAGDVLRQEFVVRSIGYESADIGFVNFPDEPAKRLAIGG